MRAARFAVSARVGWLGAFGVVGGVVVVRRVCVGAGTPVYGIASGKQCAGPLNVGDQYACTERRSATRTRPRWDTVTTNLVVDLVSHPDGSRPRRRRPDQLEHGVPRGRCLWWTTRHGGRACTELRRDEVLDCRSGTRSRSICGTTRRRSRTSGASAGDPEQGRCPTSPTSAIGRSAIAGCRVPVQHGRQAARALAVRRT